MQKHLLPSTITKTSRKDTPNKNNNKVQQVIRLSSNMSDGTPTTSAESGDTLTKESVEHIDDQIHTVLEKKDAPKKTLSQINRLLLNAKERHKKALVCCDRVVKTKEAKLLKALNKMTN